jgi:phosphomannomutase
VALSGITGHPLTLTPGKGSDIAKAFLLWLSQNTGKNSNELVIVVGEDPRLSSRLLKVACFEALVPFGVTCFDCGLTSTPAIEAVVTGKLILEPYSLKCDGAIMITSSRGEPYMNGFKLFDQNGLLREEDYANILKASNSLKDLKKLGEPGFKDNFKMKYGKKTYNTNDIKLTNIYSNYLCQIIKDSICKNNTCRHPLSDLKVCIDASNGTGGFIATKVFAPLGADIADSQYLEPDGNFFNHPPDPDNISAKHSVSMKTLARCCDLGLLFDSDLSSFVAFDKLGFEIPKSDSSIGIEQWLFENIKSFL